MDKQIVAHPNNGILYSNRKEQTIHNSTTWMTLQCSTLSERSQSQKSLHTVFDPIYRAFWKRRKHGREQISDYQGLEVNNL